MKRPDNQEDLRLWSVVAATVRPLPGRAAPATFTLATPSPYRPSAGLPTIAPAKQASRKAIAPPQAIEPGRHRRIVSGRETFAGRIDLHGMDQDRARAALTGFIARAHAAGERAVLVITGKGLRGDGILRRRVPDWLGETPLRPLIAGISEAHRRHGGEGALYVALRRR